MNGLTGPIYSILPDAFDFLMFFSIDHAEYVPYYSYSATVLRERIPTVQVKYSGTGLATNINNSAYFRAAEDTFWGLTCSIR